MDSIKEYMITRYQDGKDKLKIFGLIFLCCFVTALAVIFMGYIASFMGFVIFAIGFAFYGCYYYATMKRIEYEYIFVNGDMDIDKIMGKRKRKRLATISMQTLTQFGRMTDEKRAEILSSDATVIDASNNLKTNDDYFLQCKHKTLGVCWLVFTPNEEFVEEMKPFFPRELRSSVR